MSEVHDAEPSVPCDVINSKAIRDQSDLSDREDEEELDLSPFKIDWLDLQFLGCEKKLGISELPGCRYQDTWRSLTYDVSCLKAEGVEDVFCFCTKWELYKYRTKKLLEKYSEAGIIVHSHPIEDGGIPDIATMVSIVEEIRLCLLGGRKTLIHCFGGLGRSCAVAACLMMFMDENITHEDAVQRLKNLKGPSAIYSVKQYNYVNDFEEKLKQFKQEDKGNDSRSVSR